MPWVKFDDAMAEHRKTSRLLRRSDPAVGLAAIGLHMLAVCNASRYLTDGFVDTEWVEDRFDDDRTPPKLRRNVIDALISSGQWVEASGGWKIHDYLDHNPSRQEVLEKRAAERERKRRAASARNPGGIRPESGSPVPSRPVPPSIESSRHNETLRAPVNLVPLDGEGVA